MTPSTTNVDLRDSLDTDYIVVQGKRTDTLVGDQRKELEDLGVQFHRYIGDNTYLCKFASRDLGILRSKPYLQHVGAYHAGHKVSQELLHDASASWRTLGDGVAAFTTADTVPSASGASDPSQALLSVRVALQKDATQSARQIVDGLIQKGIIQDPDTYVHDHSFNTSVSQDKLSEIAAIDSVLAVEPYVEPVDDLNISRTILNLPEQVMQINADAKAGFIDCQGQGEVVHIADSGFDTGDRANYHAAFRPRWIEAFAVTATDAVLHPTANDLKGTTSHGTHVAGCAVAKGAQSLMLGPGGVVGGRICGPAPDAQLVTTNTMVPVPGPGGTWVTKRFTGDHRKLLDRPYALNARISNHSYGPPVQGGGVQLAYGSINIDIDNYLFKQHDLVVTWSAGNSGAITSPAAQVNGPSCCKNVITVGATLTSRRTNNGTYDENAAEGDTFSVAPFSSRGPARVKSTASGVGPPLPDKRRQKPDLCAPGCLILSTQSSLVPMNKKRGTSQDATYEFGGGTSMAAPHVAGCAAVLRQALRSRQTPNPSAALVKALLINGAVDIERGTGPSQIPSNTQGFGRVNVQASMDMILRQTDLDPSERVWGGFWDAKTPVASGPLSGGVMRPVTTSQSSTSSISIPAPELVTPGGDAIGRTLKVTLVWADVGGGELQGWLGLATRWNPPVDGTNKKGTATKRRHGNKPGDQPNDVSKDYDEVNNVQQVLWEDIPAGTVDIIVTCLRPILTTAPVDYAIAYSLE